jgi:hypothetical protein
MRKLNIYKVIRNKGFISWFTKVATPLYIRFRIELILISNISALFVGYFKVDEEGGDEDDEDFTQRTAKKRQKQQRLKLMHKIEDIFEPQELAKNLLTEFDQQVRIEDKPERFMLRTLPVSEEAEEVELEREARWIFAQAFQVRDSERERVGFVLGRRISRLKYS